MSWISTIIFGCFVFFLQKFIIYFVICIINIRLNCYKKLLSEFLFQIHSKLMKELACDTRAIFCYDFDTQIGGTVVYFFKHIYIDVIIVFVGIRFVRRIEIFVLCFFFSLVLVTLLFNIFNCISMLTSN